MISNCVIDPSLPPQAASASTFCMKYTTFSASSFSMTMLPSRRMPMISRIPWISSSVRYLPPDVAVPSLEEQSLIADFLSDFDEAISAAKKELELWKELKKGLLQQMFV